MTRRIVPAATIVLVMLTMFGCGNSDDADRLAELMRVRPGSVVADFGAGKGALAIPMARRVGPTGHVYATEIDPDQLATIRHKAEKAGLENVT
ncbi:MAG TPA: methyltransferase domain-containing protein, partial [Candidatus Binataceae bacterium]|nr:methyltransferase domain-containing protein [Candidatus Binataceae bacterium]